MKLFDYLGITTPRAGVLSPVADNSNLERITFESLFGDLDNLPVGREQAKRLGVVSRAVQIISGQISLMPMVAMKGTKATQNAFITQPEKLRPRIATLRDTVEDLIFTGTAFWKITGYDSAGQVRNAKYISGEKAKDVPASELIYFEGPHTGVLRGGAGAALRDARKARKAARLAAANPVPSVELHQTQGDPLTPEEIRGLIDSWNANQSRSKTAFTNQSLEVKTHGQAAEQLLAKSLEDSAIELARLFNLPAWAIDGAVHGSSVTYSNSPSRARELVDFTLAPYMESIAQRLSMDDVLPRGTWCRFDTSNILRQDVKTRMEAYKTAIEIGVYTVEDCRGLETGIPLE